MKSLSSKGEIAGERARRNLVILEAIRRQGPISKADISRISGVNVVTITNYIDQYVKSKLVSVKALDVSTGGRRPILLQLNSQSSLAIGIGLNLLDMVGVIVNLKGDIVQSAIRERPNSGEIDIAENAVSIIDELFRSLSSADKEKVKGIGVGIGGIVDSQSGTIRWPCKSKDGECHYSSIYVPIKEIIEKKFNLPCILENDATVSCFGEQWAYLDAEADNLIYMFSGVGCGLMFNGEVYRGTTGGAGEISLNEEKDKGFLNSNFRDSYFLKPWEDDLGIVRDVHKSLENTNIPGSKILELAEGNCGNVNLRCVFQAAQQGDPVAVETIRQAGRKLGVKVAFLVNFLNPRMVIIGGGMEEGGSILLDAVKESVSTLSYPEMSNVVKIVPSRLGKSAVAMGAASLIVRKVFAYT